MTTRDERISVADHARAMTVKERIALACGAIDAMTEEEKSVVRVLWTPQDMPLPPVDNVMTEATNWARFAPIEQVKAMAVASFKRMPAREQQRFRDWIDAQKG